jgi:superfamily I DNA/RNA helicase
VNKNNEIRIWGPPGCGKTTALTKQIKAEAQESGEDGMLVCSLTNTAANEISGRNSTLNPDHVGTLHAICFRLLDRPLVADDPKVLAHWNEEFPFYRITLKKGRGGADDGDAIKDATATKGDHLYQTYQINRAQMTPRSSWLPHIQAFASEWEAWKKREVAVDFSDMLELVLNDHIPPPDGVSIGFLDEAQDCDRLALTLFRQWGESLDRIVIAGDDDQCLFSFRGSNPEALLEVEIPDDQTHVLSQSYRIPRAVHAAAQFWIERLPHRQPKPYLPRDAEGEVNTTSATLRCPEPLLSRIEESIGEGKTVMVLAACGYMLNSLKAVLRKHGVPFHNPWRPERHDWNPLAPTRGVSSVERLLSFLGPDPTLQKAHVRMVWTATELKQWTAAVKTDGPRSAGRRSRSHLVTTALLVIAGSDSPCAGARSRLVCLRAPLGEEKAICLPDYRGGTAGAGSSHENSTAHHWYNSLLPW